MTPMSQESPDVTITRMLLAEPFDSLTTREFVTRIGSRTDLTLDLQQLEELNVVQLTKLVRRILGTIFFAPPLCSLIFTLTRVSKAEQRGFPVVADVFGNYLCDEFPNTTRDFLQAALRSAGARTPLYVLVKDLLKHLKERQRLYTELPTLRELEPAHEKLQSYRVAMLKENKKILEGAEKQSLFGSLFPKINLKYGRSVVSEVQGKFTDPTPLKAISHSIELPRSELRDPVAGMLLRSGFLKAAK